MTTARISENAVGLQEWDGAIADTTSNPIAPDEFMSGSANLKALYGNIKSLFSADEEDAELVPPTRDAAERCFEILQRAAYPLMQRQFPRGYATTDDRGGIRIEWWRGRVDCVILVVGFDQSARSYVFAKHGASDAGDMFQAHSAILAAHLKRICNDDA